MKLPHLVIPLALALAGATASSASAAQGHDFGHRESPVVGHAYVNDNTATANTVAGFDRHADGSLTPIAGSPFSVGGAGLGAGLPSQGAIQLSSDGRYLLAVDAASNQISVSRLGPDGVPAAGRRSRFLRWWRTAQHRGLGEPRLRRQRGREPRRTSRGSSSPRTER